MTSHIVIEQLECEGRCGVTAEERERPQKLAVDLELELSCAQAAETDELAHTIDYAAVAATVAESISQHSCRLLERLADLVIEKLFADFPITRIRIWLRKVNAPLSAITASVGVRLERARPLHCHTAVDPAPAPFLLQQRDRLPSGTALDLAAGTGRNSLYLLQRGLAVDAVDKDELALRTLLGAAGARGFSSLTTKVMDLERSTDAPDLGQERYDLIIVFFYLFRPLFGRLIQALKVGGLLLYETFLIDNHLQRHHPRRSEFCLAHNELLHLTSPLRVLHYDEDDHETNHGAPAAFTARLVAQKIAMA